MPVVEPKPSPQPLSASERKAQLLSKVRVYRETQMLSRGRIGGQNPAMVYCWVNQREERRMFFEAMGWELVTNDTDPKVTSQYKKPDGTHIRADLILYHIPNDDYEVIIAERELRSIEAIEGVEVEFYRTAERLGAPVYKPRV